MLIELGSQIEPVGLTTNMSSYRSLRAEEHSGYSGELPVRW